MSEKVCENCANYKHRVGCHGECGVYGHEIFLAEYEKGCEGFQFDQNIMEFEETER